MNHTINRLFLILGILALSACSSVFRSNVATFHDMAVPGGERVLLIPMDEEKKDSLEFRDYASVLASHLQKYGYKQAGDDEPQLIAGFDVSINDGREKLQTRPGISPYYSGYGYWHWGRYWGHYWGNSFHRDPFGDRDIIARTVYTVTLTVELRKPNGDIVFEGRADAEVRKKAVPEAVPFLAEALFQSFPGESGVTRRVILETEKE